MSNEKIYVIEKYEKNKDLSANTHLMYATIDKTEAIRFFDKETNALRTYEKAIQNIMKEKEEIRRKAYEVGSSSYKQSEIFILDESDRIKIVNAYKDIESVKFIEITMDGTRKEIMDAGLIKDNDYGYGHRYYENIYHSVAITNKEFLHMWGNKHRINPFIKETLIQHKDEQLIYVKIEKMENNNINYVQLDNEEFNQLTTPRTIKVLNDFLNVSSYNDLCDMINDNVLKDFIIAHTGDTPFSHYLYETILKKGE